MTDDLPDLPEGWCWAKLDDLLERIESGKSVLAQPRPAQVGEYGVLKLSAVTWGEFDPGENKAMLPGTSIEGMPSVHAGDLLISRANTVELIGAVVLVKQDHPHLLLSDKTLRLVPRRQAVDPQFLLCALRTPWVRQVYEKQATGTSNSMRNLSQDKIRSAPIALPPLAEQRRIVAKIEVLQAHLRAVRKTLAGITGPTVSSVVSELDLLERSILAKAFRGELVEQDPADEPASLLLERIRADRLGPSRLTPPRQEVEERRASFYILLLLRTWRKKARRAVLEQALVLMLNDAARQAILGQAAGRAKRKRQVQGRA
jgi:type I restriction enzyme S subunit